MKRVIEFGAFTTILAFAAGALAQEPAAPAAAPAPMAPAPAPMAPAPAPAPATATYSAGGGGGMTLPGTAPAAAVAGDSDHDAVIGSIGVGVLGADSMLVGSATPAGVAGTTAVPATIVGLRYWVDQTIGIDVGLGIGYHSSTLTTPNGAGGTTDQPQPTAWAFMLHGGVPIALASAGHFNFEVIPELNVGFGGLSQDALAGTPNNQGKISGSGFHFDVGARVGSEIHFGFMGLPKLALQGSVGLFIASSSTSVEVTDATGAAQKVKTSSLDFQTAGNGAGGVGYNNPWDFFRANVAALYYF